MTSSSNAAANPQSFFAMCPRGLEPALAAELKTLGANAIKPDSGGASFKGSLLTAYSANLHSRLASRVLWQVGHYAYSDEASLFNGARRVPWETLIGSHQTLRLDINASHSPLRSLEFALLKVKDAIIDRLRESTGSRPDIDRERPDVRVFIFLETEHASLYLDLSGESLFKRGWRADKGEAPLKENLASGLLSLASWQPAQPLLDPFCGSGTICIEAALRAINRAPGIHRRFAFERLKSFDATAWQRIQEDARAAENLNAPCLIVGRDISTRVIDQAKRNADLAGLAPLLADGRLSFEALDARDGEPPTVPADSSGVIVTNPPYGEQSAPRSASVPSMMGKVGDRLKQRFVGWQAWVLTSDRALPRQMRLQETRKTVLFNGALECRLFRFELVGGRYRPRAKDE